MERHGGDESMTGVRMGPSFSDIYRALVFLVLATVAVIGSLSSTVNSGIDAAVAVLALLVAGRSFMLRGIADQSGLRIRNFFRSYDVGWDHVTEVHSTGRPFRWFGAGNGIIRYRVVVETDNDGEISIQASQSLRGGVISPFVSGEPATQRYVSELNEFMHQKRKS
jgi:hypothetical protein